MIVADGEADRSWHNLPEMPCSVQTLIRPTAGGPAAARNDGARAATAPVLFFVDAAVVVPEGAVGRVRESFASDIVLTVLIRSYCDQPGHLSFLSQYRNLLHHYTHQTAGDTVQSFWCASGAIRRHVFLGAGGFDESHAVPSIEDVELGYRLTDAGRRIRLDKGPQVTNLKAWPAGLMLRPDLFNRDAPWAELLLRSGRSERNLNVDFKSRESFALVGLAGVALAASPVRPSTALGAAALAGVALKGLSFPFYRFPAERRGARFAACAVPWHAAYGACSGPGLVLGTVRALRRSRVPGSDRSNAAPRSSGFAALAIAPLRPPVDRHTPNCESLA